MRVLRGGPRDSTAPRGSTITRCHARTRLPVGIDVFAGTACELRASIRTLAGTWILDDNSYNTVGTSTESNDVCDSLIDRFELRDQSLTTFGSDGKANTRTVSYAQCVCGPGRVNPPDSIYVCRQGPQPGSSSLTIFFIVRSAKA